MAALSRANLLTEVRRLLNEPSTNVYSDDMINDWLDIAARNVSIITGAIRSTESETLTTGTAGKLKWALSTDFIKVESVRFNDVADVENSAGLQRITPEMIGHVEEKTQGIPRFYCDFGDTRAGGHSVFLWPTHSSDENNDTITVTGPTMVADYGGGGSETLPEYLQYPCVYFALSCAYTKDGKHRKAAHEMQRYMSIVMHYRRDVTDDLDRVDGHETRKLPDRTIIAGQQ